MCYNAGGRFCAIDADKRTPGGSSPPVQSSKSLGGYILDPAGKKREGGVTFLSPIGPLHPKNINVHNNNKKSTKMSHPVLAHLPS